MIRLENWACVMKDPYKAPEQQGIRLRGIAFGHPKHASGTKVTTSPVVAAIGRQVKTASGSTYVLGEPDPSYVDFCTAHDKHIDPNQPIKVK
jgi:hypothetical protein